MGHLIATDAGPNPAAPAETTHPVGEGPHAPAARLVEAGVPRARAAVSSIVQRIGRALVLLAADPSPLDGPPAEAWRARRERSIEHGLDSNRRT